MDKNQVLLAPEAEAYVESLSIFDVTEIGSPRWLQQHEYVEKLNMQAMCNALQNEDEFIKEFLITYEKLNVLVADLIIIDLWKAKVFPKLLKNLNENGQTFPFYFILYHELTVVNLLETVLYHQNSCEAVSEVSLDLIDYCYNKLTKLQSIGHYCEGKENDASKDKYKEVNTTTSEELMKQNKKIDFMVALKSLTILRFMIENLEVISLSATKRILNDLDVPILFVHLLENPPWLCTHMKQHMKHDGTEWRPAAGEEFYKISKVEGQVWIGLFQLLVTKVRNNYEFNSYRKSTLLKLRPMLNDFILDQMPVLIELQRFLDQLSIFEPEPPKSALIIEQLPEIKNTYLQKYRGKWANIAKDQESKYFSSSSENFQKLAKNLSEIYSFENLENFIEEPAKCALCGEPSTKKCSRCHNEWYCRRECQVNHWQKHKKACDLICGGAGSS
ncbi:hypothetical protein HELRODRAFT_176448 [Helobdella robusta]|uniref:Zinc finger MYND domain-containing protein 10 n=1 Tax=Helobdella robusta TaxID=6412 RepID=T1FAI4_HELRO|nr:hypothetical protein HELRODRAFT_176448 [Helobdella robusta]ESN99688.1 hypothetical protein HELRODRAFT_176448 [Helobdella robusta]